MCEQEKQGMLSSCRCLRLPKKAVVIDVQNFSKLMDAEMSHKKLGI
jgi:hypothetical protein